MTLLIEKHRNFFHNRGSSCQGCLPLRFPWCPGGGWVLFSFSESWCCSWLAPTRRSQTLHCLDLMSRHLNQKSRRKGERREKKSRTTTLSHEVSIMGSVHTSYQSAYNLTCSCTCWFMQCGDSPSRSGQHCNSNTGFGVILCSTVSNFIGVYKIMYTYV